MTDSKKLTLYLDVGSPFAYLAFYVVSHSSVFKECEITYVPVSLYDIMKISGNSPPGIVKNKELWLLRERLLWSKLFNVPMHEEMPPGTRQNMDNTQQALCAVNLLFPQRLEAVFAGLYHSRFVLLQPVQTPEGLRSVLVDVLGEIDANEVISKGKSDEAREILLANANKLVAGGGFGLPWFVATYAQGEEVGFFGFDHLAIVTRHLGLSVAALQKEGGWQALL